MQGLVLYKLFCSHLSFYISLDEQHNKEPKPVSSAHTNNGHVKLTRYPEVVLKEGEAEC